MAAREKEVTNLPENLSMLDDLIKRCYRELLKSMKENPKLGDFIKMIELRRKLAPDDSEQKRFWKMLEKIRRETSSELQSEKKTTKKKTVRKKRSGEET